MTIDKEGNKTVRGKKGESKVEIDYGIEDVNPDDFDALFIPGGFSRIHCEMMIE